MTPDPFSPAAPLFAQHPLTPEQREEAEKANRVVDEIGKKDTRKDKK